MLCLFASETKEFLMISFFQSWFMLKSASLEVYQAVSDLINKKWIDIGILAISGLSLFTLKFILPPQFNEIHAKISLPYLKSSLKIPYKFYP